MFFFEHKINIMKSYFQSISSRLSLFFLSLFIIFFLSVYFNQNINAAEVTDIEVQSHSNYLRVIVNINQSVNYNIVNSLQDKQYFYINIYNITKPYKKSELTFQDQRVSGIKIPYYPEHRILRVVFYASPKIQYNITTLSNPARLVIDVTEKGFAPSEIYRKKIVVIDPGHGGKSLGGRSAKKVNDAYVYEKTLTLQMAKKLKALFDSTPNITAYLTREEDKKNEKGELNYLGLKDRIVFSEKHKGDIFISIHCNDSRGHQATKVRGIEFYYWNETSSNDAAVKYLEELNNDESLDVDISNGNAKLRNLLTNVLKDKLEEWTTESAKFCELLNSSFKESAYYKYNNRGIKSARFKVLENYNMPAVLIETGFINNNDELKKLMSPTFQDMIVGRIFNSVNNYFAKEDPKFQPNSIKVSTE